MTATVTITEKFPPRPVRPWLAKVRPLQCWNRTIKIFIDKKFIETQFKEIKITINSGFWLIEKFSFWDFSF